MKKWLLLLCFVLQAGWLWAQTETEEAVPEEVQSQDYTTEVPPVSEQPANYSGRKYEGQAGTAPREYRSDKNLASKYAKEHNYFNIEKKKEDKPDDKPEFKIPDWMDSPVLKWTLLALLLALVLFLVMKIILQSRVRNQKLGRIDFQVTDEVDENLIHAPLEQQLAKALQEENFRLAIRIQYLLSLQSLARKNHILLKRGKTNREYAGDISNTALRSNFLHLCTLFEWTWYNETVHPVSVLKDVYNRVVADRQKLEAQA